MALCGFVAFIDFFALYFWRVPRFPHDVLNNAKRNTTIHPRTVIWKIYSFHHVNLYTHNFSSYSPLPGTTPSPSPILFLHPTLLTFLFLRYHASLPPSPPPVAPKQTTPATATSGLKSFSRPSIAQSFLAATYQPSRSYTGIRFPGLPIVIVLLRVLRLGSRRRWFRRRRMG